MINEEQQEQEEEEEEQERREEEQEPGVPQWDNVTREVAAAAQEVRERVTSVAADDGEGCHLDIGTLEGIGIRCACVMGKGWTCVGKGDGKVDIESGTFDTLHSLLLNLLRSLLRVGASS